MKENEKDLIKAISNLVQLDIDAVHAYDQAIKELDDPIIKERLMKFQEEHRNHISGLAEHIANLGGQPPEPSQDFKGYVIEAFAAIRSFHRFERRPESHEDHRRNHQPLLRRSGFMGSAAGGKGSTSDIFQRGKDPPGLYHQQFAGHELNSFAAENTLNLSNFGGCPPPGGGNAMRITSPEFEHEGIIPRRFTCGGEI